MMKMRTIPLLLAAVTALTLSGLATTASAGETRFRTIEHRTVAGYRTGHHRFTCPPGQYRAHGACYPEENSRGDRYNPDYRYDHTHRYRPHRGFLHRFDSVYLYGPYRYRSGYRHHRHGYRWGIHLDYRNLHRYCH